MASRWPDPGDPVPVTYGGVPGPGEQRRRSAVEVRGHGQGSEVRGRYLRSEVKGQISDEKANSKAQWQGSEVT